MSKTCRNIILFFFSVSLFAQNYEQLVQEKKSLKKESVELNTILKENQLTQKNTIEALSIINTKISLQNSILQKIELEIKLLENNKEDLELQLTDIEEQLERLTTNYKKLIKQTHYASRNYTRLLFFLSSKNFNQLIRRAYYFRKLERSRRNQFNTIQQLKMDLEIKKEQLVAKKANQTDLLFAKKTEIQALDSIKSTKNKTISFLQTKEDSLFTLIEKKKGRSAQIISEISQILTKEKNRDNKLTPELKLISTNFAKNKGRLPWPTTQGSVISKFGKSPHPVLSGINIINNGIEIATSKNQVRTIFNGEVANIIILPNGLRGIIIRHGEYFSVYSNLAEISVQKGDPVETKSILGSLYNIETGQRNILEFQIWKLREKLNPEQWLSSY